MLAIFDRVSKVSIRNLIIYINLAHDALIEVVLNLL